MWVKVLRLALLLRHCPCLACPSGYTNYTGTAPLTDYFSTAAAPVIDHCADNCDAHGDCLSFEYNELSQLCQLNVHALPTTYGLAPGVTFCSKDAYWGWGAVNLVASSESFRVDTDGRAISLGAVPVGQVQAFAHPVSAIGQRRDGLVAEWANLILSGREFCWQVMNSGLHRFTVFALEDSLVTVTFYGMMTYSRQVWAGMVLFLVNPGARQVDVNSTGDVLVAADSAPVPPAAETIFGQCSTVCHINVFGGDDQVQLTRSCTNGTTDTVAPGRYWQDGADYSGETCVWSAPSGYRISGHADEDGSGVEGSSFQAAEHFQLVTPLPDPVGFASLFSNESTLCTHSADGSTFELAGTEGVYHARVTSPPAGTVIACDAPVAVVASLSDCSSMPLHLPCNNKVLNLVTAPLFPMNITFAFSTITTSSTSGTNTTSTTTSSSLTTTTTSTATDQSSTATSTASTATTTATTSRTATTTTDTNSGTVTTTTTATTTTTTASSSTTCTTSETTTVSSMTIATATTTSTRTASTGTAYTSTASTSTVSTSTASTGTALTSATSTSTSSSSTESTSTTASSTATSSTATTTTRTASTTTATTATATTLTTTATTLTTTASSTTTATATSSTESTATSSATSSTTSGTMTKTPATDARSTATATTVTTSTTTSLAAPSELVKQVEKAESSVLADLLAGNTSSSVVVVDGFTVVAAVLEPSAAPPGTGNLTVAVEGTQAKITVPVSALGELDVDGLILLVSFVDPNGTQPLRDSVGEDDELLSVVSVNLFTLAGDAVTVDRLEQPIEIVLPAPWNVSVRCSYWDELDLTWSARGLETDTSSDGLVLCRATHLTLFAAILRGFTKTFECSKLFLFTAEGLAELGRSGWYNTPAAWAFGLLVLVFVVLLLGAAARDRCRQKVWTDEHFLIANDMSEVAESELSEPSEPPPATGGCILSCLLSCRESAALRDALDDLLSRWFGHFGEVRSFVEGLWEGMELSCCFSANLTYLLMSSMLAQSARRQAAASLGISKDSAMFVLEDEDARDLLVTRHVQNKKLRGKSEEPNNNKDVTSRGSKAPSTARGGQSTASTTSVEHVDGLHALLGQQLEDHLHRSGRWCSLPGTVLRLFLWGSPVGSAMVRCIFYSSALRMMFFTVEVFGALMLAALFFQSSGGFVSRRSRFNGCSSGSSTDVGESIGRLLAVGVSSALVAGIPSMILQSLSTRSVKRFDSKDCPGWKRQLRVWRTQDRIAWTLAILYVGFCIFFIALFLANVVPEDQSVWTISGIISVAEDIFVIPLAVALFVPLLAIVCLSLVSCTSGVRKQELLRERHVEMYKHANLTLPLIYI